MVLTRQLLRLVQQLRDLDECKEDMTEEEYNESKEDTREQLRYNLRKQDKRSNQRWLHYNMYLKLFVFMINHLSI